MAFCENCGAPINDGEAFCGNCGYEVKSATQTVADTNQQFDAGQAQQQSYQQQYQQQNYQQQAQQQSYQQQNYQQNYQQQYQQQNYQQQYQQYNAPGNTGGITGRSLVLWIILSIITCGICGIIWMIKLNDEVNYLSGEPNATSGGTVFLLSLVTCGIYGIYWFYKMGERCDRLDGTNSSNNILFLVLGIFGLGIINFALMQDKINKKVGFVG